MSLTLKDEQESISADQKILFSHARDGLASCLHILQLLLLVRPNLNYVSVVRRWHMERDLET